MDLEKTIELYGNLGFMAFSAFLVIYLVVIPKLKTIKKTEDINTEIYKRKMLGDYNNNDKIRAEIYRPCDADIIKDHYFFHKCEELIHYGADRIDFGGEVRNRLFASMLKAKIDIFSHYMATFRDKHYQHAQDWLDNLQISIREAIKSYNKKWIEMGVPMLAIDKFNEFHNNKVQNANDFIQKIAISPFYDTTDKKTIVMLDLMTVLFNQTCEDVYDAAWVLNGDLTGMLYQGQPIEALHKEHNK